MAETEIHLDLDKARAARLETKGPRTVRFDGRNWILPAEIPASLSVRQAEHPEEVTVIEVIRALLGDQYEDFVARASDDDLAEFTKGLVELYGTSLGESEASADSSEGITKRSRRTSSASTGSTSGKRSGARKRSAAAAS